MTTAIPIRRHRWRFAPAQWVLYLVLVILAFIYIYPFVIQVLTMLKEDSDATLNPLSLPQTWTTAALTKLFLHTKFPLWTMNSVLVSVLVTLGRAFFNSLAGYALARLHFRGRNLVFAALVAVMAVPGVALLVPRFLIIRDLGLYDTYPGMILPFFADAAGVFIMKNFFESIPVAVEESAMIDGASTFRIYWFVVLPMAMPALVTIMILAFQGSWNELQQFLISAQSPNLTTLSRGVASLVSGAEGAAKQFPLRLAAATMMTLPVAVIFFIFSKRIMNIGGGAVKE